MWYYNIVSKGALNFANGGNMGIFKTGNKKLYEIIKCFCKVVRRNGIVEIDEFCVLIEKEFEDCEIEHKIYISLGNAI